MDQEDIKHQGGTILQRETGWFICTVETIKRVDGCVSVSSHLLKDGEGTLLRVLQNAECGMPEWSEMDFF